MDIPNHETERIPNRLKPNTATQRHIIVKFQKTKTKKSAKERSYIQGNHRKTMGGILNRNISGKENRITSSKC